MKTIAALLLSLFVVVAARAADQRSFATEAEVSLDQTTGHYLIVFKVSELITKQHEVVEKLISAPQITVVAGKGASLTDTRTDGTSVSADVFWPESDTDKPASVVITLRSESKVLTRSTFKLDLKKT